MKAKSTPPPPGAFRRTQSVPELPSVYPAEMPLDSGGLLQNNEVEIANERVEKEYEKIAIH